MFNSVESEYCFTNVKVDRFLLINFFVYPNFMSLYSCWTEKWYSSLLRNEYETEDFKFSSLKCKAEIQMNNSSTYQKPWRYSVVYIYMALVHSHRTNFQKASEKDENKTNVCFPLLFLFIYFAALSFFPWYVFFSLQKQSSGTCFLAE